MQKSISQFHDTNKEIVKIIAEKNLIFVVD